MNNKYVFVYQTKDAMLLKVVMYKTYFFLHIINDMSENHNISFYFPPLLLYVHSYRNILEITEKKYFPLRFFRPFFDPLHIAYHIF
jgi:hypothetical protein